MKVCLCVVNERAQTCLFVKIAHRGMCVFARVAAPIALLATSWGAKLFVVKILANTMQYQDRRSPLAHSPESKILELAERRDCVSPPPRLSRRFRAEGRDFDGRGSRNHAVAKCCAMLKAPRRWCHAFVHGPVVYGSTAQTTDRTFHFTTVLYCTILYYTVLRHARRNVGRRQSVKCLDRGDNHDP